MRLLLIKAMAGAHAYSQFVEALHRALLELGHEAVVSDQSAHVRDGVAPVQHLVDDLQIGRYDAVLSFSSYFGTVRLRDGRSLFDALGVKFAGWQLDHPIYAPASLAGALQNRFTIHSNENHLRYAEAVKLPGRGKVMLPGGEYPLAAPKSYRARDRRVFIAATYRGEPGRHLARLGRIRPGDPRAGSGLSER